MSSKEKNLDDLMSDNALKLFLRMIVRLDAHVTHSIASRTENQF